MSEENEEKTEIATVKQPVANKETVENIPIELSVVLGSSKLRVNQLLKLGRGAVVELDKGVNEPVEIFADDVLVAKGDVVVTESDMLGISLIEVMNK